jgi:hypothetical protein
MQDFVLVTRIFALVTIGISRSIIIIVVDRTFPSQCPAVKLRRATLLPATDRNRDLE